MNTTYHLDLRTERLNRDWTQKEAAKRIGISRSYYSDIENGRTIPSGKMLFKINNIMPIFLNINDVNTIQRIVLLYNSEQEVKRNDQCTS